MVVSSLISASVHAPASLRPRERAWIDACRASISASISAAIRVVVLGTTCCASSALASTYVVDATGSPGATFTDISTAIAATTSGDVLKVLPGSYAPFTLDRGVVIVGYGQVDVQGTIVVTNIGPNDRVAIVGVDAVGVSITNCFGAVLLQDQVCGRLFVSQCNDVRILESVFCDTTGAANGVDAAVIEQSRVELSLVGCLGAQGASPPASPPSSTTGGRGLHLRTGSRVFGSQLYARGGLGGDSFTGLDAGNGGPAIRMENATSIQLSGANFSTSSFAYTWSRVFGGGNGKSFGGSIGGCMGFGFGACGIEAATGASGRYSNTQILGSSSSQNPSCSFPVEFPPVCGTTLVTPSSPDPTLFVLGTPVPGGTLTLQVCGAPGDVATVAMGRAWVVVPTPGVDVERLVSQERVVNLGVLPASGVRSVNFMLAPSLPTGTMLGLQATTNGPNGMRRSNSAPIVVR